MDIGNLKGIIEMDENFFAKSFKGNHKKSITFIIPRYLYWFKWLEKVKQDKDLLRMRTLVLDSVSDPVDVRQKQYRVRPAIFQYSYSITGGI